MKEYNIYTNYEFFGEWWQPNNKRNKFYGKLEYITNDNLCRLTIISKKIITDPNYDLDCINGINSIGDKITLFNCFIRSGPKSSHRLKSKSYEYEISVDLLIIGKHYKSFDDLNFSKCYIYFSGYNDFIRKHGFNTKSFKDGKCQISYEPVEDICIFENSNYKINICFEHKHNVTSPHFSCENAYIKQDVCFCISCKDKGEYTFFREEYIKLKNFLTFCLNETIYYDYLIFYEKNNDTESLKLLSIYYAKKKYKQKFKNPLTKFFTLKDIESGIIKYSSWLNLYKKQNTAIKKYFSIIGFEKYYVEDEFILLVQCFEDFYRHTESFTQFQDDEIIHDERITEIFENIPENHITWLKKKLNFSNEINLAKRLKNILKEFLILYSTLYSNKDKRKRIASKITNTRNYLIHASTRKEPIIKMIVEYYDCNCLLKSIIKAIILLNLGLNKEIINDVMYRCPHFKRLLYFERNKS